MGKSGNKAGPKTTQRTTSVTPASIASTLTSFSPASTTSKSSCYAHLHRAPDAHTLRVYEVATGKCVSRWASNAVGDEEEQRVESIEWALIPEPVAAEGTAAEAEAEGKRGKKRRKSDSALELPTAAATTAPEDKLVLALGLTNGSILLWTPNGNNPVTLSHPTSTSPVTALSSPVVDSSSASSGHLWSAHADGAVRVWDLATGAIVGKASGLAEGTHWDSLAVRYLATIEGAKRATAHLLLSHLSLHLYSVALPAAGKKDKIRDLKTIDLGRCTGHIEACSVLFPPSSSSSDASTTTFLSYAPSDRFVQIWSLPLLPSPTPSNGTLLARLALPSGVSFVALHPSPLDPTDESVLAAIDTEGQVSLARLPAEFPIASASPKKGKSGIVALEVESEVVGRAGEAAGVVKVLFGEEGQMVLVRGGVKPVFESVAFADANGAWIARIELERAVNGLLNGAEDVAGASLPTRYAETSASTVRTGDAIPAADSDDEDSALANSGALDVDMAEPTLADRLKAMNVTKAAQAIDSDDGTEGSDEGSDDEDEVGPTTIPATGLTTTLIQALHSSDAPLLESCLSHSSPSLIRATVKRLPSGSLVLGLLEVLVERLGKGKKGVEGSASVKRARGLIEWVRQVLIVHVGFLVTIPSLVNRLATLHASLSSRLALQPTLLALNGRLELVMSQIDLRQERVAARASVGVVKKQQGKTYVEGESSSEEEDEGMSEDEGSVEDVVLGSDGEEEGSEDDEEDSEEDDEFRVRRKGGREVAELLDLEASEEEEEDEEDSDEEGESEDSDED